jgi:hypothetical protein
MFNNDALAYAKEKEARKREARKKALIYHPYLSVGDRVALSPSTDLWMCGERYATVTKIGTKYNYIVGDKSQKTYKFPIESCLLEKVYSWEETQA